MLYYLLLPLISILLVVVQTTIADVLFSGRLVIELSLIAVIYTGFRLDLARGAVFAFVLGFVFDCIAGSVMGLFTFIYIIIFFCSFIVSFIMDSEKAYFVALFCFLCALIEETIVILFYNLVLNFDAATSIPFVFLPQALVIGLFAPVFFYLMRRIEVFFYGKPFQRAEHIGNDRISSEI